MQKNVTEELITWLRERERVGYERYGGPMRSLDGRDLPREALEEALDLIQYLFGFMLERQETLALLKKSRGTQKVYVAGPYTGDGSERERYENTVRAIGVGNRLLDLGYIPFVPHLTHFWDLVHKRPYEDWLKLDFAWLASCDALLLLPGKSPGAERELQLAKALGIPVFTSLEALEAYAEPKNP